MSDSEDDFFGGEVRMSKKRADDNDDYCTTSEPLALDSSTTAKVSKKLSDDGYRIGKGEEEERQTQKGFNVGFHAGQEVGRLCSQLLAAAKFEARFLQNEMAASCIHEVERIVFEEIPRMNCRSAADRVDATVLSQLVQLVMSTSPTTQTRAIGDSILSYIAMS